MPRPPRGLSTRGSQLSHLVLLQDLEDLVGLGSPLDRVSIEALEDPGSQENLADPLVLVIL